MSERTLIEENLRERCVYEVLGDRKDQQDEHTFFNYMDITHTHCLKITDDAKREECFKGAMDAVNIPIADV